METKKIAENELPEEIYTKTRIPFFKIILFLFVSLIIGFFLNFPIRETMVNSATKGIHSIPNCNITYDKIAAELLFFPKIIIDKPVIPGYCVGSDTKNLKFDSTIVKLIGPSFYPLGIKLHSIINKDRTEGHIYVSASPWTQIINIQDTNIDLGIVQELTNNSTAISGNVSVDSIITIAKNKINDAKLLLKSKDLTIPPQNINGMQIPQLPINTVSLKGVYKVKGKSGTLNINNLIMGDDLSPIIANFKGSININTLNITYSKLNLVGEVRFSEQFLEDFSILKLFLNGYEERNGFYQVKIGGTFGMPIPQPL